MNIGSFVFASRGWDQARDNRRRIGAMRRHLRDRSRVNRVQDERLDALEQENEQLELCVATLARLLVEKGVLSQDELADIGQFIDKDDVGDDELEELDDLEPL